MAVRWTDASNSCTSLLDSLGLELQLFGRLLPVVALNRGSQRAWVGYRVKGCVTLDPPREQKGLPRWLSG